EPRSDETLKRRAGGGEGTDHDAVDQHVEALPGRLVPAALSGVEGQDVGAGRPVADGLAERAGPLEEGDLRTLGSRRVARGEVAIVSRDDGRARESPGRAGRPVLEVVGAHHHLFESYVRDCTDLVETFI